jgi:hypothetical protein
MSDKWYPKAGVSGLSAKEIKVAYCKRPAECERQLAALRMIGRKLKVQEIL